MQTHLLLCQKSPLHSITASYVLSRMSERSLSYRECKKRAPIRPKEKASRHQNTNNFKARIAFTAWAFRFIQKHYTKTSLTVHRHFRAAWYKKKMPLAILLLNITVTICIVINPLSSLQTLQKDFLTKLNMLLICKILIHDISECCCHTIFPCFHVCWLFRNHTNLHLDKFIDLDE